MNMLFQKVQFNLISPQEELFKNSKISKMAMCDNIIVMTTIEMF